MKTVLNTSFEPTGSVHRTNPIASFFAILLFASAAFGQVKSPIVGVSEKDVIGGSDTFFGIPLQRDAIYSGTIDSVTPDTSINCTTITPDGNPSWTADEFALSAFVRITSGRAAGRIELISENQGFNITVKTVFAPRVGDSFEIIPGWTLDSLFPPATQTTFHLSIGKLPADRGSELLFYPENGEGIETSPISLAFLTSGGWTGLGDLYPRFGGVVLSPGSVFAIRHPDEAADTKLPLFGNVDDSPRLIPIQILKGRANENFTTPNRATSTTLRRLGLKLGSRDRLLVFDDAEPDVFRFDGRSWLDETGASANNIVIEVGSALAIRKAAGTADKLTFWKQLP